MSKHRKLNVNELNRLSASESINAKKEPFIVVLDNVRSLNNIGSIFRTCDALAAETLFLCGITATPPNPEIYKTALGAENSVQWKYFETTKEAIITLREQGYIPMALEQTTNSMSLLSFSPKLTEKYAFVFGNELKGVSQEAIDMCCGTIEVPQFGSKHSFNVSVTVGIVLWDFCLKMHVNKKGSF